ncbi:phage tail assembly chaperone [Altererythrobacter aquiaggeris]|uniref:phage tail assembly chaperone n=1 Tax=Aestuarierythrobacter aquiaggeris TaxID=1898396 RepID=UPI003019D117
MSPVFGNHARKLAALTSKYLGWRPGEFWASTPAELVTALSADPDHDAPLARSEFETLMERDRNG